MDSIKAEMRKIQEEILALEDDIKGKRMTMAKLRLKLISSCQHDWYREVNGPNNDDRWWVCRECGATR
jgi:hypothetical protein